MSEISYQMSDDKWITSRICLETIVKPTRSLNRSDKNSVMYLQISVGKCGNKCVMRSIWGISVVIFEGYTNVLFFQSFNHCLWVSLPKKLKYEYVDRSINMFISYTYKNRYFTSTMCANFYNRSVRSSLHHFVLHSTFWSKKVSRSYSNL